MQDRGAIAKTEFDVLDKRPVGSARELIAAMQAVHQVFVSDTFLDHVVEMVTRTRRHPLLELGCSPRAGISMVKAARARALIHGRDYVVPEDLYSLAEDVMMHRIRLNYEALADGHSACSVLNSILNDVVS
jgi:MoxR-like ATPase